MQFNLFPITYASQLRAETDKKITQIKASSEEHIHQLETNTKNKPSSPVFGAFEGIIEGGGGGLALGLIVCTIICAAGSEDAGGVAFILCGIIGAIAGAVTSYKEQSNRNDTYHSSMSTIEYEKRETPKKIEEMNSECERKIAEYSTQFEEEAKKASTSFAESKLAIEVIEWMTTGFAKVIDTADRRSHIENIFVPFQFKVYRNKITCNLGTFDFEIKRCANLNSPMEQTALARAIASAIQLNITMRYPKDASGTDIVTNINYAYESDNVTATLSYSAVNGNYRAVQGWTEK